MKTDFGNYLEFLGCEKFRSIIIHSESSRLLTQFAKYGAKKYHGEYFDCLDYFIKKPEFGKHIDIFGVENLVSLLKEHSKTSSFIFIDKIDFLLDTWKEPQKMAFYRLIKNQWNSYLQDMKATLAFCLHPQSMVHNTEILDSKGGSRIHPLSDFKAIH